MNKQTLDLIKQSEGVVLKVYLDSAGLETCGVGHLLTAEDKRTLRLGQKITTEQSDAFLVKDLALAEKTVNQLVKVAINENQKSALISLVFNIGAAGFHGSSVLRKLNQGDFKSAAEHFKDWCKETIKGRLVFSQGLMNRRLREKALFEKL